MELRILGALEVEEDGRVVRIAGAKQRTSWRFCSCTPTSPSLVTA